MATRRNRTRQYGENYQPSQYTSGSTTPTPLSEYSDRLARARKAVGGKFDRNAAASEKTPAKRLGPKPGSRTKQLAPPPPKSQQLGPDPSQYGKTLEDFLAQARAMLSGSSQEYLSGIGNREAALKSNAADIQGKIGSGYNALSSFIAGQATPIAQNFQTAIDQTGAAQQQAQEAITKANADAQAQQQAIMSRLGIQDANIVLQNTGTTDAARMTDVLSDSAQRAQAAQNMLAMNQNTEQNYNTSAGTAAALEGQGQKDRISRDLMSRLAELQDQRSMASSSQESDALSLAQSLMDQDYRLWSGNYDRGYQQQRDAMEFAMQQQQLQAEANQPQEMNATSWSALGPAGQASYALQNSGIDPQNSKAIIDTVTAQYGQGNFTNAAQFVQAIQRAAAERGLPPVDTQNAAMIYYNYFQ